MARFDNLGSYAAALEPLDGPLMSFLEEEFPRTAFGRQVTDPNCPRQVTCFMDYLFVWLVEGEAALLCPTFESWLLAVIRYADDIYSPRHQRGTGLMQGEPLLIGFRAREATIGLLDWGAISRSEDTAEEFYEHAYSEIVEGDVMSANPPADAEGMRHPALDRHVYERCRERARERRQHNHLKDALGTIHYTQMH